MGNPERSIEVGRSRGTLALLWSGICYVMAVAYLPELMARSPIFCVTNRCLGLHCPACGLTRAIASLLRLDPQAAVQFNPLVVLVAPLAVLFVIDTSLLVMGRRGVLASVPRLVTVVFWATLFAGFGILFVVRVITWLIPAWNPNGWMIPPSAFPT
jgi:hypothetical protein